MKLKLPAYAKDIIARRRAGKHPWSVVVCFTAAWKNPTKGPSDHPIVMVPPGDYEAGKFEFSFLHNVAVNLVADGHTTSPFLSLAMECAAYAAPVNVHFLHADNSWSRPHELGDLLFSERKPDPETHRFAWPRGWSDQQMLEYERRCSKFWEFENYFMRRKGGAA